MSHPTQATLFPGLDGLLSDPPAPEGWEEALSALRVGPVVAIDEAGRGPLAGPVCAAAVVFDGPCAVAGVGDSKALSPQRRQALVRPIRGAARAWGLGLASAAEIDRINILEATRLASRRAVEALGVEPAVILSDALTLPWARCPVIPIVKGDARVRAIGAASVLAKEHRDAILRAAGRQWPLYGLKRHRGYPTASHREAIRAHGPSTFHRITFRGAERAEGQALRVSALLEGLRERNGRDAAWAARLLRRRAWLPEFEIEEIRRLCGV